VLCGAADSALLLLLLGTTCKFTMPDCTMNLLDATF
jgi:hypothetical protein